MDEDGGRDEASPWAPLPKLMSPITDCSSLGFGGEAKRQGRGFREGADADRSNRTGGQDLDSRDSDGGPGLQRSIEGWILLPTKVHEEAGEDNLPNAFSEYGEIKNLHLNLDRHADFVKIKPILRLTAPENSQVWGWIFVVFGLVSFVGFVYAAIISKVLPPAENFLLSAIQQDRYYCLLVPLSVPILVVAVYFHWLCMKLFKHA